MDFRIAKMSASYVTHQKAGQSGLSGVVVVGNEIARSFIAGAVTTKIEEYTVGASQWLARPELLKRVT